METVLSVQFEPLNALRSAHYGLYWEEIRSRFPESEDHPPLSPARETFGDAPPRRIEIKFEALESMPLHRVWFLNQDKSELIQLQNGRFIKNWKKSHDAHEYPRYNALKAQFDSDFASFQDFVRRNQLGVIAVNQREITYVNHIAVPLVTNPMGGFSPFSGIEEVFTVWSQPKRSHPGPADDVTFHARFTLPDNETGKPIGRLHADLQLGYKNEDEGAIFVLELTARGQSATPTGFFDIGREAIVRAFKNLTTKKMHKIWQLDPNTEEVGS